MANKLKTPTKRKTSKKKTAGKSRGGSLNSKNPNPYEIAYKKLWDKLPQWQKDGYALQVAEKKFSEYGMYAEFVRQVARLAEKND